MHFIIVLTFCLTYHFGASVALAQCYWLSGGAATSDVQPCSGNLASGSHSACCNLGKNPPDICLGGGLCQRMDATDGNFMIYAVGCTDRSGKDAACPQYCPNIATFYSLNPCYGGSKPSWCCNDQSASSCCGGSGGTFSFNLTSLILSSQQSSPTTAGTSGKPTETGSCDAPSCPVGVGAVVGGSVGSFAAGTIIAGLLGLYLAERRLRKKTETQGAGSVVHAAPAPEVDPKTEWRADAYATQPIVPAAYASVEAAQPSALGTQRGAQVAHLSVRESHPSYVGPAPAEMAMGLPRTPELGGQQVFEAH